MNIGAVTAAATVAMILTIAFLLIAHSWHALSYFVGEGSRFSESIMREAAQQFRDECKRLSASLSIYLAGIPVFVLLFTAAYLLQAERLFAGYPNWQLGLVLGVLILVAILAAYKMTNTFRSARRARLLRDASLAIGHQLQQLSTASNWLFHDVKTSAGIIDHVVISREGIYAVNVVGRRSSTGASAHVLENLLRFSTSEEQISVVPELAKNTRLAKHFTQLTSQRIRVRSVIAVPGWETPEQTDERHLVVNEKNVSMLLGWKDKTDLLMDDDVQTLVQDLTSRCRQRVSNATKSSL
jgi:type II secretory pathway pseudopilin PulG